MLIYAENAAVAEQAQKPSKPEKPKKKLNWKSMTAEEYKNYLSGLGGAIR